MPTKPIGDNERKACDAVVRSLEELSGVKRANGHSPEDNKVGSPVEYVFDLGATTYAVEHTVVEAFSGQIQTGVHFEAFVEPIVDVLGHHMPSPGTYRLFFSVDPSKGMKPKDITAVQTIIMAWVKTTGAVLHEEFPEQPPKDDQPYGHYNFRQETVGGVEVLLRRETGWWMPDKAKGRLLVGRFAPDDYKTLRRERLREAMNRKLPKLDRWKKDGARSVLVLENRDMALSNHWVILEAAEYVLEERPDRPDEIWLVDTTIEKEWTVWCLVRDGVSFPDDDTSIRYREFSPNDLVEV